MRIFNVRSLLALPTNNSIEIGRIIFRTKVVKTRVAFDYYFSEKKSFRITNRNRVPQEI